MHTSQEFSLELTRCQTSLYAYILSLVPNRNAAEDVLQETNLVLLRKSHEFTPGSDFLAWAATVARYTALHARRQYARDQVRLSPEVVDRIAARIEGELGGVDARRRHLRSCLQKLVERDRRLIEARYQTGSSVQKLAEESGRSAAATSQKLYRLRAQLMECVRLALAKEAQA